MIWNIARTWGYVAHDANSGVVLPKRSRVARRFFSVVEVQRILAAAVEPLLTFLWLAVETGMRAGELCGLRIGDIEFDRSVVYVRQSAWRRRIQSPKSEMPYGLLHSLQGFWLIWRGIVALGNQMSADCSLPRETGHRGTPTCW